MRDQHDIPVLLTGCLAAGGAGMFLIMSVLIGFGVSTLIGREAMYLCLLLELVNLLLFFQSEVSIDPVCDSRKTRCI